MGMVSWLVIRLVQSVDSVIIRVSVVIYRSFCKATISVLVMAIVVF